MTEHASTTIRALLAEAERKRNAALDREVRARHDAELFGVEVEAYRRALSAMTGGQEPHPVVAARRVSRGPKGTMTGGAKWVDIYSTLFTDATAPYSYADLASAAVKAGHEITFGGLRAQMMNAVNSGLFVRVGAGKFNLTDQGLDAINVRPNHSGPSSGVPDANAEEAAGFSGVLNPNPALDGA